MTTDNRQSGFAVVVAIIMIALVMSVSIGLLSYVTSSRQSAKKFEVSNRAVQMAEAGIQKALYCLGAEEGTYCGGTHGENYIGEDDVTFDGGYMDIIITYINEEERDIAVVATEPSGATSTVIAMVRKELPFDDLTQFPYSVTSSNKTKLKDDAVISNGPVYSNGDIDCKKNVIIDNDVYTSLPNGIIDNCEIIGNAHAARIRKSTISEGCYYNQSLEDTECGSEHFDAVPAPIVSMPDFDLDFWRTEAAKGGVILDDVELKEGDYNLGPIKIEGKLKIEKANVTLQGPVWVTEKIEIKKESVVQVDPIFETLSSVLLGDGTITGDGVGWGEDWPETADDWFEGSGKSGKSGCKGDGASGGRIKIDEKVKFRGTGLPGSYVVVVSTSTKSPAIEIKKESPGAIYLAPNSSVKMKDEAAAVAVAAKCVEAGKRSVIGYDEFGLPAQLRIVAYVDDNPPWKIIPGTWREL